MDLSCQKIPEKVSHGKECRYICHDKHKLQGLESYLTINRFLFPYDFCFCPLLDPVNQDKQTNLWQNIPLSHTWVFEARWRKPEKRKDSIDSETLGTARERWEKGSSRSHRAWHIPHTHTHTFTHTYPYECTTFLPLSQTHTHNPETADRPITSLSKVCVPVYVNVSCFYFFFYAGNNVSRNRPGVT